MTCTAVAWSSAPEWKSLTHIQRWPGGQHGSELKNKVATQVSYDAQDRLVSFGFECDWDTIPTTISKEFKLYLDPSFPDTFPGRPTHAQAAKSYCDYMMSLRRFIDTHFQSFMPDWQQRNVEFVLSIPTTFTSPSISAQLKGWLQNAGFADGYNRRLNISQTEAEAAAVYAAKAGYRVGDIILVVDAGGATTDVNILKITEHTQDRAKLKALDKAEGINVGSTLIDTSVAKLIKERMRLLLLPLDEDELQWAAEDLMKLRNFEGTKCAFDGSPAQLDTHMMLPNNILPPHLHHVRQNVTVTASELKQIFDEQIQHMFQILNKKLLDFSMQHLHQEVKYLVLSGGLGSSPYLQRRMKAQYPSITVLIADEPQLAVVKGLVMERVQELTTGSGVYTGKCCRVSYGVLTRLPYDELAHRGETLIVDPIDKMKWVENQIDWLIKEGKPIPEDGFTRGYRQKIAKGEEDECVRARFVMSELPADSLPKSMKRNEMEVSPVCTIRAHFSEDDFDDRSHRNSRNGGSAPFKLQKPNLFRGTRGREHYVAEFNLRILIGSTDLKFSLEGKNGRKFNQNDASVAVEWHDAVVKPKITTKKNQRSMYPATSTGYATREKSWRS